MSPFQILMTYRIGKLAPLLPKQFARRDNSGIKEKIAGENQS